MADSGEGFGFLVGTDQPIFGDALVSLVSRSLAGADSVGVAKSADLLHTQAAIHQPLLVITDVRFGGRVDAVSVLQGLRSSSAHTRTVVVTSNPTVSTTRLSVEYGARGVWRKTVTGPALGAAIEAVLNGGVAHDPTVSQYLNPDFGACDENLGSLTVTEFRALELLAQGTSRADMASELFVSTSTLDKYLSSVFRKLGVNNARAAGQKARSEGLLPPGM